MTADSVDTGTTAEDRFTLIYEQLADLRSHTAQLARRVRDANATAADLRSAIHVPCSHGEEVRRLTESLTQVEHELEGLRVAMTTRGVIERAKGMLMLREHCDADTAFRMLVDLSQRGHRRLVEVATTMVDAWSAGDSGES